MDSDLFLNAGIQPPFLSPVPIWPPLSSTELNCTSAQSPDYFLNWDKSTDRNTQFDSALSSIVSSPAASNSNVSGDGFLMRELIGKLGSITNSTEISATSCYSTPLNSPPKPNFPINSTVAEFSADPGFAERAARFSSFGSRSFNSATQFSNEFAHRSSLVMQNGKLPRVSSTPSLMGIEQHRINPSQDRVELSNSQEESTISEQKASNDSNSKKRKVVSRAKPKVPESNENMNSKRGKGKENENGVKMEEDTITQKPPEPPKDYIHVRARRGQATDSHSLAERVRREKIGERMKLLQDLVPGCNKVTGKALMLDEIINYVQSLQRQVEFLSMKLSSVDTMLEFGNVQTLVSNDIFQSNKNSPYFGNQNGNLDMQLPHPVVDEYCASLPKYPSFNQDDLQTIVQMGFGHNLSMEAQSFQASTPTKLQL